MSGSLLHLFLVALFLLQGTQHVYAQAPSREYQLKAVFLFNFTQFVNWPVNAFENDQSPLVIGVIGENPFGAFLVQTVSGEKINGHPLVVQHYKNEEEIKSCHILFVNIGETKKQEQVLGDLQGKNILTVSDDPDFLKQGGMVRFVTNNNKIKLQINMDACKESKMVLSSKLLRLAEIIKNPVK
ncbi:MAG TPA: YfiR family protein [Niastella sp.]